MRSIYRKLSGPLYQVLSHDQDSAATAESIDLHLETLEVVMRGDHDAIDDVIDGISAISKRAAKPCLGVRVCQRAAISPRARRATRESLKSVSVGEAID